VPCRRNPRQLFVGIVLAETPITGMLTALATIGASLMYA
jgi:hypothetical protein